MQCQNELGFLENLSIYLNSDRKIKDRLEANYRLRGKLY